MMIDHTFFVCICRYDKRNINAFLSALNGLQQLCNVIEVFTDEGLTAGWQERAALLAALTTDAKVSGESTDLLWKSVSSQIAAFHTMFDRKKAAKEGVIEPQPGTDEAYDSADRAVSGIKDDFALLLSRVKKELRCRKITYFGTKPRYQIETK